MRSIATRRGGVAALALVALFTAASMASAEDWGTVKGTVKFDKDSPLPKNPEVEVNNDKVFCTAKGKIHKDEWVVDSKTRGVKNAIVWLSPKGDATLKGAPQWNAKEIHPSLKAAPKKLEVDQPVCTFMPRVIALREETELTFKNSAPVAHNVSIEGGDLGPVLNASIPGGKSLEIGKIKARNLPTPYKCTIHPWMKGWLVSFKHPYYAVTDEKGEFTIKNAPAGEYRLQVWQEGYGYVQKGSKNRGIVFTVKEDKDGKSPTVVKIPELQEPKD